MPARRGGPSSIDRRRREGYGEGEGADYKGWDTVRSVSSHGASHRPFSLKAGRMLNLLSDKELHAWYLFEWSNRIGDLREQFPMHELAETQEIAASLGYEHPTRRRKQNGVTIEEDKVMTVDFLLTLTEEIDGAIHVAISVKTLNELNDRKGQIRTLQKEEITRVYWQRRGIPFRIVTENEMPRVLIENLSLVLYHSAISLDEITLNEARPTIYEYLASAPEVAINRVCALTDERLRLAHGTSLKIVWHAIANRIWSIDLNERIAPERPLRGLALSHQNGG
jgi:hypothetical protein